MPTRPTFEAGDVPSEVIDVITRGMEMFLDGRDRYPSLTEVESWLNVARQALKDHTLPEAIALVDRTIMTVCGAIGAETVRTLCSDRSRLEHSISSAARDVVYNDPEPLLDNDENGWYEDLQERLERARFELQNDQQQNGHQQPPKNGK